MKMSNFLCGQQPAMFLVNQHFILIHSKQWKDACLITLNALNAAVSSVSSYIRLIKITIEKTTVGCDAGEARSIETYRSSLTMLFFFLNFQLHFLKASLRNKKKKRVTLARLTLAL